MLILEGVDQSKLKLNVVGDKMNREIKLEISSDKQLQIKSKESCKKEI